MSVRAPLVLESAGPAETDRIAEGVAVLARRGDLVLLEGDLGAGKSAFARAFVRALSPDPQREVPSPTYTLVQTYEDAALPLAHADLYRLGDPDEVHALALDEALENGAALVEWPERAGGALPGACVLGVRIEADGPDEARRRITLSGDAGWADRLARFAAIRAFLARGAWAGARRRHLQGDASMRAYERLERGGARAVLMNAPERPDGPPVRGALPYSRIARLAETVTPFLAVAGALRAAGASAPEVFQADPAAGLVILEDLGREGVVDARRRPIAERYEAAADLLAGLHKRPWPARLPLADAKHYEVPAYDGPVYRIEAELFLDWYLPGEGRPAPDEAARAAFAAVWDDAIAALSPARTLTLRDFHSPNLLWLPARQGAARVGVLDFQDALLGPPAYDLVSLLQDARVDVAPELEEALLARYLAARSGEPDFDAARFRADYAILGVQRASKILGIFRRLDARDGKPAYLSHLPRMRRYLARALAGPVPPILARWYEAALRAPIDA